MNSRRFRRAWFIALMSVGVMLPFAVFGQFDFNDETSARFPGGSTAAGDTEEKDFAWGDVDEDGDMDLVVVRKQPFTTPGKRVNRFFMNVGGGVFENRTGDFATASDVAGDNGFNTATNDRDVQLVDLTGDGLLDIVTATTISVGDPKEISHPRIYRNLGFDTNGDWLGWIHEDFRFPELMVGAAEGPRFCSVAHGDIDGDGDEDLYFGDYDSANSIPPIEDYNNRLLLNDGTGVFTDVTTDRLTVAMYNSAFGAATEMHDINGDGALDIVKQTSLQSPQHVAVTYNNPSNEGFYNGYDIINQEAPYFVDVGDLNNDGLLDMVVVDDNDDRVLINTGNSGGEAQFTTYDFSFPSGGDDGFGGNALIADLDGDGFDDVIITDVDVDIGSSCSPAPRRTHIYHNQGDTPLVTMMDTGNQPWTPSAHDVAVFDINEDGFNDMIMGGCADTKVWIQVPNVGLAFSYPQGQPDFVDPTTGETFQVSVTGTGAGVPAAGSLEFFLSVNGGAFSSQPVTDLGNDLYQVTLPGGACGSSYAYYFTAETTTAVPVSDPSAAPGDTYGATVAPGTTVAFSDDLDSGASGWTVINNGIDNGMWQHADPNGTTSGGQQAAPGDDAGGGGMCFVTENAPPGSTAGLADVDGAVTRLVTPAMNFAGSDGTISFDLWYFCNDQGNQAQEDFLNVNISNDDGNNWVGVGNFGTTNGWETITILVSAYVTPTSTVRLRFNATDDPNDSITEAGIDNLVQEILDCPTDPTFVRGDYDGSGNIAINDPIGLLGHLFLSEPGPVCADAADGDDNGTLGLPDALAILNSMFGSPTTPLPAPYPTCGTDPSADALDCASFPSC